MIKPSRRLPSLFAWFLTGLMSCSGSHAVPMEGNGNSDSSGAMSSTSVLRPNTVVMPSSQRQRNPLWQRERNISHPGSHKLRTTGDQPAGRRVKKNVTGSDFQFAVQSACFLFPTDGWVALPNNNAVKKAKLFAMLEQQRKIEHQTNKLINSSNVTINHRAVSRVFAHCLNITASSASSILQHPSNCEPANVMLQATWTMILTMFDDLCHPE